MKKLALAFITAILAFTSAYAQTPSDQLAKLLNNFYTMRAQFEQKPVSNNALGNGQVSAGNMAILRPGKFLWQVEKPNKQLLVTNGKYVWMYDTDLEQVTKQLLSQANTGTSPAILLSGSVKDLQQRFNVSLIPSTDKTTGFMLVPLEKSDMFAWVKLYFLKGVLTGMELQDNLGQRNQFTFTNVVINPSISPQLFEFKAPPGVDVINN